MRRAASEGQTRPKHRVDYEAWDDDDQPPPTEKRRRRHKGSLRQWAEALVADGDLGQEEVLPGPVPDAEGLVLFATAGRCRVLTDTGETLDCVVAPDFADAQRSELAVGDRAQLVTAAGEPLIVGLLPRSSVLSRPDSGPGGAFVERVIAANVDCAVVVAAAREPALRPRLLDRYLVAVEHGGAAAIVCVTKIDLLDASQRDALDEILAPYESLGTPVVRCSSTERVGLDVLRRALQGRLAVLVGQSGVGKSSLLNALEPRLAITTRDTTRSRKGRHTTTASTLHLLDDETRVTDTPGVPEFGLWDLSAEELRCYFHEFDSHATSCRYAACCHFDLPTAQA
jgi:ribosome biogenesis GTPase